MLIAIFNQLIFTLFVDTNTALKHLERFQDEKVNLVYK